MINLAWIVIVLLAVVSQWYIIEVKKRYPNKKFWFTVRCALFGVFMWAYVAQGYVWYWALLYMVGTFWFPFNTILNLLRGKRFGYLSAKNSGIDRFLLKYLRSELVIQWFGAILFIAGVMFMYHYGLCAFSDINYNGC